MSLNIPLETQKHLDSLIGTHLVVLLFDINQHPIGYVSVPIEDKEGHATIYDLHCNKVGNANWNKTPLHEMVNLLLQKKTEKYIT